MCSKMHHRLALLMISGLRMISASLTQVLLCSSARKEREQPWRHRQVITSQDMPSEACWSVRSSYNPIHGILKIIVSSAIFMHSPKLKLFRKLIFRLAVKCIHLSPAYAPDCKCFRPGTMSFLMSNKVQCM